MCSWCWGFSETYQALISQLDESIELRRLLGGLAADNHQPMTLIIQQQIQANWRLIEQKIPSKKFNFDFWCQNTPKRSTYPACRAVIAAREQGDEYDQLMTAAIQRAYYQQARNPSEITVLVALADELGIELDRFQYHLESEITDAEAVK